MSIFGNLFARPPSPGEAAFDQATRINTELIMYMRDASGSTDAARALMADIWAQHNNVPFLTTVYEAVQEMKSATSDQR